MLWQLRQPHSIVARQNGVLIAVAAMYLPLRRHASGRSQLNPLGPRFADIDAGKWIGGVRRRRIAAIKLKHCKGQV